MCGIKVCDYITWKPDIDMCGIMCGIKVCDYITWKPDIDINVCIKVCDYLDESLILTLMCGIKTTFVITLMCGINESLILTLMCGIKVCDYITWKPDIDINVWYKGLWLH